MGKELRVLILASGRGSHFENIFKACKSGDLKAEVVGLLTSKTSAPVLLKASEFGVFCAAVDPKDFPTESEWDQSLTNMAIQRKPDLVVLAGFTRKIGQKFLSQFSGAIINIHPSLLPKYGGKGMYGRAVHEAVLANGDKITGATVHFIDGEYDRGEIIDQTEVRVNASDTAESLAEKVLKAEHELYLAVLRKWVQDKDL